MTNNMAENRCPRCSKNSIACVAPNPKTDDRPMISETLLGSFLASVLWLKKRETSLSKSIAGNKKRKMRGKDSTARMIYDMCEMLGGFTDSSSEVEEPWSETEQSSHSLKTSCNTSTSVESNESESAVEEAFGTPPPTPPPSFLELKPKPSVTCMGDLSIKDKKKSVGSMISSATASVAVTITEEVKSTIKYLKSKTKALTNYQPIGFTDEKLRKFPEAVEFTIASSTITSSFDVKSKLQDESQSPYSSDSLNTVLDFDSDEMGTSSLSGEDEMEEFPQTKVVISKSESKAIRPRASGNEEPTMTTYKTPKPAFFEVWRRYPKLFVQDVVTRTGRVQAEKSWEVKKYTTPTADQLVALVPGEKREKEVVIENSNLDLVIYIQVEVEEDDNEDLVVDFKKNSLGTQTSDHKSEPRGAQEEEKQSEKSLYDVWKKCEAEEMEKAEESVRITFSETVDVQDRVSQVITFDDEVCELFIKKDIQRERRRTEQAVAMAMKEPLLTASAYLQQQGLQLAYAVRCPTPFYRPVKNVELEKALALIREIETDVVDTKLSDAILILPRLESELRKHFKHKVKKLGESEYEKSLDSFFSAFDIWPIEALEDGESETSEERLFNLLTLLQDLERAVKASECSDKFQLCGYNSSKIYGLLHALTESIRELEECSNVTSLSQTLDIASQLDTAVREYENVMKTSTEYFGPSPKNKKGLKSQTSEEMSSLEHLKNVRKKVFEMVEEEAVDTEARLERDSERLERLERENNEAMKFVEAFLQKTQRRATELTSVKAELKELSTALEDMHGQLVKAMKAKNERHAEPAPVPLPDDVKATEPVKETVSGLLHALDNLKSRAREKHELCREILSSSAVEKEIQNHDMVTRSSRSSFTAKNVDDLSSIVKEFRKIGDHSLYLSWSKPEGPLADSMVGYEIFVNGKLSQKVRNPQRLQAVVYSVDLSKPAEILLYGLLENGLKMFLLTVTYESS